ncbi:tRNA (N6-isopentenyl adenosine(37)-C2)-methylthiotransferase MiaB [Endozoicomonas sp. G2_2]|uniref:tRNA (N6-isopentenyl adenosine(37)-C2)-methylthiotransferase MiaB n=1 Tax=Endozoicomonas sp. G2_2 TaxID=2821092 RepID=UPI001ADAE227|nr:tRNA (N6-isopentenyl adenosine(37)-C2)-methylthiotransferase MiaB [Endozoicomonas sp. G2_2]MBO9470512.1 tRNA (N6-isopentenyl adenosine(37)-C2)-methylthiotransferase MiaB [Endozoicomonas sp. G2_2]
MTSATQPKVFVQTWGCQMNEYDSAKMVEVLRKQRGAERVNTPEEADVILLNTCSVREKAAEKVFSQLGRWRELKLERPEIVIGVGGCVASQEGHAIRERAPFVDMVFGPQTLHRLPEMLDAVQDNGAGIVDIAFPEIDKFDHMPPAKAEGATAFVSIMEGCSKYCSFCVVPYTRGEEISRPFDDVILEVAELAEQGVKEITLLGQNVNGYRGPMEDGSVCDLAMLVEFVAEIEGIERIRYTTSHPLEFSDALIEAYARVPKLANYLHLPVQSGSDAVLADMKRGYTADHFRERIAKLREVRPDISLSTDIIVGHPGEGAEEFEQTMQLVEDIGFDAAFSFVYSKRPGTPAADMADETPRDEKKARLARLQKRIGDFNRQYMQGMVGTTQRVLVERESKRGGGQMAGRTDSNRWVNFDGHPRMVGHFIEVEVTEALDNSLRGRVAVIEPQPATPELATAAG